MRRAKTWRWIPLLLGALAGPAALPAQVPAEIRASEVVQEVRLADGSTLIGRVVEVTGDRVVLVTSGGARVEVDRDQILSLRPAAAGAAAGEGADLADPNLTRLFFGPTGRSLGAGEGYVGLFELFFPFVSIGVTDWVTLSGGTPIVPEAIGEVFYLAPKVRLPSFGSLDLAAGVLAFFASEELDEGSVGILYGVGTWGSPDAAVTVGVGFPFAATDSESELAEQPIVLFGGERRTGRRSKLITENYFVPGEGSAVASAGLRLFGDRFSGDVGIGALVGEETACCLPVLNFVYTFGAGR